MSLVPVAVALALLTSALVSLALRALTPALTQALRGLPPRASARWSLALLAAPAVLGALVVLIAFGHCAVPRALGRSDDCVTAAGLRCAVCLLHPAAFGLGAWALAAAGLALVSARVGALARGIHHARRAHARLRMIARPRPDGSWAVPGAHAFVVGWPAPVVCIGEDLDRALSQGAVEAIAAHERAHLARGDVVARAVARLLAVAHLPAAARPLLDAFDLAHERACDERASRAVADPVLVAETLIEARRLQSAAGPVGYGCACASLDLRVSALCEAPAPSSPRLLFATAGAASLALGLALSAPHEIHRVAELVATLLRG
ncbi:MAG: M48 family metalloprotease [Polyangiales bacterium]